MTESPSLSSPRVLEIVTVPMLDQLRGPFVESCSRLRRLHPDYPRVYAVAAVAEEGRRRWWQLAAGARNGRIDLMYSRATAEMPTAQRAADVVSMSLIHAVVGRVVALLVLEGRAWDPGLENLWIHTDNDGGIDWAGVADTTLRVLPTDRQAGMGGTVTLPCEQALIVWTAHRCVTALNEIADRLDECSGFDRERFWGMVGEAVAGASTYIPIVTRTSEKVGARRGQAMLDVLTTSGHPVRRKGVA